MDIKASYVTPEELVDTLYRAINFIEIEVERDPFNPFALLLTRDAECFRIMIGYLNDQVS